MSASRGSVHRSDPERGMAVPVGAGSVRLLVGSVEMDVRVPVSLMLVDVRVDAHAECTAKGPQCPAPQRAPGSQCDFARVAANGATAARWSGPERTWINPAKRPAMGVSSNRSSRTTVPPTATRTKRDRMKGRSYRSRVAHFATFPRPVRRRIKYRPPAATPPPSVLPSHGRSCMPAPSQPLAILRIRRPCGSNTSASIQSPSSKR